MALPVVNKIECPVCGEIGTPKFSVGSDWCVDCGMLELGVQMALDDDRQDREYI